VLADGVTVAFVKADARRPGQPALLERAGTQRSFGPDAVPSTFPAAALVEPLAVSFAAADGLTIPAQIFRPSAPAAPGEKRPGLIFFHGGSRRQMLLGWNYRSYYHNAYAFNQYMAGKGYVVLSVNYRSGIGYGLEFREALNYGASGASEYHDVVGAGLYLRAQPDVDPARIGLWGGSYGGYLTAMGLARASDLFAAGVDVHGVHDWNNAIRNFMPDYNQERRPDVARLAFQSSPMAFIDGWRSPVLLIHGDDDRNVPFSESVELVEQLRARKVHVEQLVFPDEVHGFLLHGSWRRAYAAAADFLDRHLAPRRAPTQGR
jgi:dipeptidyl aminopeptidase/acylaminoacyl peptidase